MRSANVAIGALIAVPLLWGCIAQDVVDQRKDPQPETAQPAMFRANPEHTGVYDTQGVHQFSELVWKFETDGFVESSPAIVDGIIYFGSLDGHLYAVDTQTGRAHWSFDIGEPVTYSSPAVADGAVYFGSLDGILYVLDSRSGLEKWTFEVGGILKGSVAIEDGTVYLGGHDGPYAAR